MLIQISLYLWDFHLLSFIMNFLFILARSFIFFFGGGGLYDYLRVLDFKWHVQDLILSFTCPVAAPEFFFLFFLWGHRGGKMRFWGGKNPKICRKWLTLATFFLLTGGGAEPPTGGWANAPMTPLMPQLTVHVVLCPFYGMLYFLCHFRAMHQ